MLLWINVLVNMHVWRQMCLGMAVTNRNALAHEVLVYTLSSLN